MGQTENSVFISYRRVNIPWALLIYKDLSKHGYDVFIDYLSINSGNFEKVILGNIKARAHFLVLLTPSALEKCNNPNDWLRREIETAIDERRNIIPLFLEGFDFGTPSISKHLTGKLGIIKEYNGLDIPVNYFDEAMERLRKRYLNVALDEVLHPLSITIQNEVEKHKVAADKASVNDYELQAQNLFEKAFQLQSENKLEEAINLYEQTIQVAPNFVAPYYNLGILLSEQKNFKEAEEAIRKAIELDPSVAGSYLNLGSLLSETDRIDEAEIAYHKAIELDPNLAAAHYALGLLLEKTDRPSEAEEVYQRQLRKTQITLQCTIVWVCFLEI